jgi:hypothetical protein
MPTASTKRYKYDVCLSFADAQRSYVESVAKILRAKGVKVYIDAYDRVGSWGKDLYSHLDEVFRAEARYCVLFLSKEYARDVWTSHERESAQARALNENYEYVLPARFDGTQIPGIRPTVGYVDLKKTGPGELVEMIIGKIGEHSVEGGVWPRRSVVSWWSEIGLSNKIALATLAATVIGGVPGYIVLDLSSGTGARKEFKSTVPKRIGSSRTVVPKQLVVPDSSPSPASAPVTVAVKRIFRECGGDGWILPTGIDQMAAPPGKDADGWEKWARSQGAIDSDITELVITIQGRATSPVYLNDLSFYATSRTSTLAGIHFSNRCGDAYTGRIFDVDLDRSPPRIDRSLGLPESPGGKPTAAIRIPYKVSNTDGEVFSIYARTNKCICRWYGKLSWSTNGTNGYSIISDGGKTFETAPAERAQGDVIFDYSRRKYVMQGPAVNVPNPPFESSNAVGD